MPKKYLLIATLVGMVAVGADYVRAKEARFSHTYAEEAIPETGLPKVVPTHPRLLVRRDKWEGGLSLPEFHARGKLSKLPWAKHTGHARMLALYYLSTGDTSVVQTVVNLILNSTYWPSYACNCALAFDWIYPALKESQKKALIDHLVKYGHALAKAGEGYSCLYSHYSYYPPSGLLMIGLALDGDHPDAKKFQAWAMGYFKKNYFPAWQRTGGGWQGGGHAYYRYAGDPMILAIACWASATDEDVFKLIKQKYGNWLEEHMYFLIYQMLPDKTRVDSTGFDYAPDFQICKDQTIMLIARGYKNPDGYAYLRWMGKEPKKNWLLYDAETDAKKPLFPDRLPLTKLWGRDGFGYLQMRSNGWKPDSTVIEFKCGDYFWSHNFLNQNSFYIYHKGRLVIQSGFYDCYGGNHFDHYYSKTISSNSMLIFQPGEFTWTPIRRPHSDIDKEGFFPEPGGQRVVAWGAETCFTFREFLSRSHSKQHFETGNIVAFEHAPDFSYSYVCGDATDAYNNPKYSYAVKGRKNRPKITRFTRSLAFLDRRYLVIFDRVDAVEPSYRKAWLLHSISKPEVRGNLISAEVPGHIEDFDGDEVVITYEGGKLASPEKNGRLFIRTFLPEHHYIRRIGGKGYEFYSNGKNRPLCRQPPDYCKQETGNWRIEISPSKQAKSDVFLHLLYPCDSDTTEMPKAELIVSDDKKMVGISVGGWVVMFGKAGEVDGTVRYRSLGKAKHLVVDLMRGVKYKVSGVEGGSKVIKASEEGCLHFTTAEPGIVTLTPMK